MTLAGNLLRLLVAVAWTGLLGVPLLLVLYGRYLAARLAERGGKHGALDAALEANARLAGRIAQGPWSGLLLRLAGIHLRIGETVPVAWHHSHVVCANHASILDILALVRVMPPPFRFVAKRELLKWPIFGWLLRPAGQIIVDRQNRRAALASIREAGARGISGQVIFFVEGTRSRTGELLPFKRGAFHYAVEHDLPVLPTAILGTHAALSRAPWWQLRPGRTIDIRFGVPVPPPGEKEPGQRVDLLLEETRRQIRLAMSEAAADLEAVPADSRSGLSG